MSRLIHMGQRLKQILKHKKIKIVDFADMAGFTNQIAHYHLRKSDMKRSTLERFCELVGITPEEFYEWNSAGGSKTSPGTVAHHGRRLMELVGELGLNKTRLSKRLGMSRRTIYNLFEKETFTADELETVSRALEITVTGFLYPNSLEEARQADNDEMLAMREKYYKLLEEHNQLLKNFNALKEHVDHIKKELLQLRKQARLKKS